MFLARLEHCKTVPYRLISIPSSPTTRRYVLCSFLREPQHSDIDHSGTYGPAILTIQILTSEREDVEMSNHRTQGRDQGPTLRSTSNMVQPWSESLMEMIKVVAVLGSVK